jgi:hypothetical protein
VLPVTTNLYGTFGAAGDVVPIYGLHLLLLALLNSALWACVLFGPNADRRVQRTAIVAPAFVAFVNAVALMLAFLRSPVAPYLWYLALAGPMVDSRFTRALD